MLFSDKGNYVYLPVSKIPEVKHKDVGFNVSTLANITADEKIIFGVPISDFEEEKYVLFTTKNGLIKRTLIKDFKATRYSNALQATKLREGDVLTNIDFCSGEKRDVVVITKEGFVARYEEKEVSIYAPASFGMRATEFGTRKNDEIVGAFFANPKDIIIMMQQKGNLKKFKVDEITKIKRSNVAKPMVPMTKNNPNYIVSATIIHKQNLNEKLNAYVFGEKGFAEIDYNSLKSNSPTLGKSFTSQTVGKPTKIIISMNNNDLND